MAVEDILKKISGDFQNKKEKILLEANQEKERIIREAKEKAEEKFKEIISQAEREANLEKEKLIALAKIESQKEILSFKRKILEEVFEKVLMRFSNKKIKKKLILPDKELEEEIDFSLYLKEIQPKLEIEVSKILWPE